PSRSPKRGSGCRLGLLLGCFAARFGRCCGRWKRGNDWFRFPCRLWNAVDTIPALRQADEKVLGVETFPLGGADAWISAGRRLQTGLSCVGQVSSEDFVADAIANLRIP